ncbi:hypothetical protein, partial [Bacteroides xylanisolvens]|uniref:hypothetical protein n=1 Tax=Bacteroides xylanisolvens TaxID=371601 RepID=UPI00202F98E7
FNYPRFGRQTVFWGECLKIQKRQLTRNELVALNFIILGISLHNANLFLAGIPTFCKSCCVHVHWFSGFI